MRLIVTGCLGFIGSHFCEMAIEQGHEVVGIDALTYAGRTKNLDLTKLESFYYCDINDSSIINHILNKHQPDAIVHFAAESHVARSIESRDEFLRTNVGGTNILLNESLKYWRGADMPFSSSESSTVKKFTFLHVSTDEVYGSIDNGSWTEKSSYCPNNAYSASKAASDHLVRAYQMTYGLPTIITHASNNIGTKQHPEKFIPTLIKQMLNGEPMTLHGDGLNVRDWLLVSDHCRGILLALKYGKHGEVYNFGGLCERTNLDIAKLIAFHMGVSPNIKYITNRAGNDKRYSTDISKANNELKWLPFGQIEDNISEIIEWYVKNPNYSDDYSK